MKIELLISIFAAVSAFILSLLNYVRNRNNDIQQNQEKDQADLIGVVRESMHTLTSQLTEIKSDIKEIKKDLSRSQEMVSRQDEKITTLFRYYDELKKRMDEYDRKN